MAADTVAVGSTANSAEVSWTVAAWELITGSHSQSQEGGKDKDELHFDGLGELVKVLLRFQGCSKQIRHTKSDSIESVVDGWCASED